MVRWRNRSGWSEALELLITGLLFIVLFLLGCYVGLATGWPSLQESLSPEARFFTRTAAVLLGVSIVALLYRRLRKESPRLVLFREIFGAIEERALRIASQKALLLSLRFTDKLEDARHELLAEYEKLEMENGQLRSSLQGILQREGPEARPQAVHTDNFEEALERAWGSWKAGKSFCLVLVSLDDLGLIRSSYGAAAEETILRAAAALLKRAMDPGDEALRAAHDRFGLLLNNAAVTTAAQVAERLRRSMSESAWSVGGVSIRITASFGVAGAGPEETPAQLLSRAREALELAGRTGPNRVITERELDR